MSAAARNGKSRNETRSVLKVLILGDGAVGKSCIMTRFINNQFEDNSFHTIGVEFLNKEFTVGDKTYTLQVSTHHPLTFLYVSNYN
jgi:GTPase SAR1 family protein